MDRDDKRGEEQKGRSREIRADQEDKIGVKRLELIEQ